MRVVRRVLLCHGSNVQQVSVRLILTRVCGAAGALGYDCVGGADGAGTAGDKRAGRVHIAPVQAKAHPSKGRLAHHRCAPPLPPSHYAQSSGALPMCLHSWPQHAAALLASGLVGAGKAAGGHKHAAIEAGEASESQPAAADAQVLEWLPPTVAAVGLRLSALDAALIYSPGVPPARDTLQVGTSAGPSHTWTITQLLLHTAAHCI